MPNRERAEVLQGTLDIMVLQTVAALGPSHGSAMAARIEQFSGSGVQLNMGTLYAGLMRLEQRGFVRATWGVTGSNREARFYALTPAGKKQPAAEKREWNRWSPSCRRFSTSRADVRCDPRVAAPIRATFHKAPEDAGMEEELRLHVDMIADELKRRGLSFEDAPARCDCRPAASRK